MNAEVYKRVVEEKVELDKKIVSLTMFINGEGFIDLDKEVQDTLYQQLEAMTSYSRVLRNRLHYYNSMIGRESEGQTTMSFEDKSPGEGTLSPDKALIYVDAAKGWVSVDSVMGMSIYNKYYDSL